MKYINRTIEQKIDEMKYNFPVILITGARQSGKSTLLEYINNVQSEKINYVTLDNIIERSNAIEDPESFLRLHEAPLIIDEFQYAPNLLSYIKIHVDEARKKALFNNESPTSTMYYLTGSQVFQTMKNVSESLAGRIGILELNPLSTRELNQKSEECFIPNIDLLKKKKKLNYEPLENVFDRILRGSYPALYNQENMEDTENKISDLIYHELNLIGITPKLKGREYAHDAILYLIQNSESNINVIQYLTKIYKKSGNTITNGIQNAIIHAWRVSSIEDLSMHYTAKVNYETGVPTPMEFIYYYVEKIKKFI